MCSYLLSNYYMLSTVLAPVTTAVEKKKATALMEFIFQWADRHKNKKQVYIR